VSTYRNGKVTPTNNHDIMPIERNSCGMVMMKSHIGTKLDNILNCKTIASIKTQDHNVIISLVLQNNAQTRKH
jgi:hypothetical protein